MLINECYSANFHLSGHHQAEYNYILNKYIVKQFKVFCASHCSRKYLGQHYASRPLLRCRPRAPRAQTSW